MRRRAILIGVALLCGASVVSTATTPTKYCTESFYVKEGDVYKMARNRCPQAEGAEVTCVTAATIEPGNLLVWPEKESKEPIFRALTYAGIQENEIVLTRDPGPSIRLPIKGIFTKYGILNIAGHRIILDIVYPDKIKAKVRHAAKRCKCE